MEWVKEIATDSLLVEAPARKIPLHVLYCNLGYIPVSDSGERVSKRRVHVRVLLGTGSEFSEAGWLNKPVRSPRGSSRFMKHSITSDAFGYGDDPVMGSCMTGHNCTIRVLMHCE